MDFKEGDRVEYPTHPISWQDDGTWVSAHVPEEHAAKLGVDPVPENWKQAEVIAVFTHPVSIHTPDSEPDTVVALRSDDEPPFHLNAKLVRLITGDTDG